MNPKTYVLVACAARKAHHRTKAGDLYRSTLFLYSRQWARAHAYAGQWYILSAKHGLLHHERLVDPYNLTLNTMTPTQREQWAGGVRRQLRQLVLPGNRVVFLAGVRYREGLVEWLRNLGCVVETPLEGLPIGKQVQWLRLNTGKRISRPKTV